MASRRSQIMSALHTALNAEGKPAGVTVTRSRTLPFESAGLPAMALYRLEEEVSPGDGRHGYHVRRMLRVRVDCRVAVPTDGEALEDALDPLTSWAVTAVMADRQLGGLAHNVSEAQTGWATEDTDMVLGGAGVDFIIEYLTAADDPDSLT